ncbi:KUP/HAK/KT family potassium transporter [Variovorax sp. RTB1]|uniref:potassium transporter Kup n=1 Tax=Variovorax sp. RTB1 TaxID=3048631 RepID=UPI002B231D27|nr:KUP/HAK/KT family potassium transporter [Variovorax sp. RTB1]MEB0114153.1 KUP/HAK/KT family potassium transporter [Variovorax sp. RTB1]
MNSLIQGSRPKELATATGAVGALGVVFGDIGTSPLYTFKTVLDMTGGNQSQTILGVVSLLVWTLIIVTSLKYAGFAMRIDNDGEGGILALLALLAVKRAKRPLIVAVGLFGAALIYGDGAITPAISVLSAIEGLKLVEPTMQPFVLPVTVGILVALFAVQGVGTAKIGRAFGPIMAVWFVTMAALGIWGIAKHPAVLYALNPYYGVSYLFHSGYIGFMVLGGVFLCVTGAEALYADMGHFGARPIKFAWSTLVFPSLVLNYAGQGAIVLSGASTDGNIFYRLCPPALLLPLVVLSTVATIIASQSIITGAFSMTRQAIQLGWMPRMKISQTSAEGFGQIYVGTVNWVLMIVTVGLTLAFGKSDSLAGAYGIAVSATMILTTVLLFIAMREIWGWSLVASAAVAGVFMIVDASFFASNLLKLLQGGYVPLLLAAGVYGIMYVWHRGISVITDIAGGSSVPAQQFFAGLERTYVARVPGTGVFLTRAREGIPPIIQWYVHLARALPQKVVAITVQTTSSPWVAADRRAHLEQIAPNCWFVIASYGFMETPDLPSLLAEISARECPVDLDDLTYFIGVEKIVPKPGSHGIARWMTHLFAAMARNSAHVTDSMRIPPERLVDLGRQVQI